MNYEEKTKLIQSLEEKGVDRVRKDLALSIYGANKKPFIEAWLESKSEDNEERKHQDVLNQHVKSARIAAWISGIATLISLASLAITFLSWYFK